MRRVAKWQSNSAEDAEEWDEGAKVKFYDPLAQNYEHFASFIRTGRSVSNFSISQGLSIRLSSWLRQPRHVHAKKASSLCHYSKTSDQVVQVQQLLRELLYAVIPYFGKRLGGQKTHYDNFIFIEILLLHPRDVIIAP